MENDDISRRTIMILVVLTLVVSLLSTWTVLNEVNNMRLSAPKNSDSAEVRLRLLPPTQEVVLNEQPMKATANVGLILEKDPNN